MHLKRVPKKGSRFGNLSFVSISNGVSRFKKWFIEFGSVFEKDWLLNKFFNDCLISDGYFSWIVCERRFSSSKSIYFSEVEWLLSSEVVAVCSWLSLETKDKSGWKGYSSCGTLPSRRSSLSVMSVSFKKTNWSNNVLFFTGFLIWLWNDFTASNQNECSGLVLIFFFHP